MAKEKEEKGILEQRIVNQEARERELCAKVCVCACAHAYTQAYTHAGFGGKWRWWVVVGSGGGGGSRARARVSACVMDDGTLMVGRGGGRNQKTFERVEYANFLLVIFGASWF